MRASTVIGQASLYDDFLPGDVSDQLWRMMSSIPYSRTDSVQWVKVWTLADGAILRSHMWEATAPHWKLALPDGVGQPGWGCPPALAEFLGQLRQVMATDDQYKDVKRIVLFPYVWPPKTSISWHSDGAGTQETRIGAFTYYVHKHWNAEWGGEFLLTDIDEMYSQNPFDNSEISEAVVSRGHGFWASPKPNRLIVNPSNMYHKVVKTTEAAAPRMSIQGFFYLD